MRSTGAGRRRHRRKTTSTSGFTLVEVMVGGSVFVTAVMLTMGSILSSMGVGSLTRESAIATEAAQKVLEEMRQQEFTQLFVLYNSDPADDPYGAGSAPGSTFEVDGLSARSDDGDGFVGEVQLPVLAASPALLREDLEQPLGALDLNGDGAIDALDHAADYAILPVRVTVRWSGAGGDSEVQLVTLFSDR